MIHFPFKTITAFLGGLATLAVSTQAMAIPVPQTTKNVAVQSYNTGLLPVANQASSANRFAKRTNPVQVKLNETRVPSELQRQAKLGTPAIGTPSSPVPVQVQATKMVTKIQAPVRRAAPATQQSRWAPGLTPIQQQALRQHRALQRQVLQSTELITSKSNLVMTEIKSPKFVNVGQAAPVQVSLRNLGREAVQNVTLIATLPPHVTLASASPKVTSQEGQTIEFVIARIGAEDVRHIILNLVANEKLPMDISTQVRVENLQRTLVAIRQPELSLTINGPQRTNIGQTVTHELLVTNVGDGIATDVHLDVEFPEQLRMLKPSVQSVIRRIEPGKSVKVSFESLAQLAGSAELKIAANSTGAESQQAKMNTDIFEPELRVSAVGPQRNFVDRDGIYTITVENTGEVDISDVQVALAIPAGLRVNTISQEASVDAEKGILYWSFKAIAAKSTEIIQLKATATQEGSQVCNIVVSSTETREREFQLATQVSTRADLNVVVKNQTGPVPVGGHVEFMVEVENLGTRRANDVNIRVVLPECLKVVTANQEYVEHKDNMLLFAEPQVEPGQKVTFKFTTVASKQGEHVVRSTTEIENSERQLISEDVVFVYGVDKTRVSESLSPVIPSIR